MKVAMMDRSDSCSSDCRLQIANLIEGENVFSCGGWKIED